MDYPIVEMDLVPRIVAVIPKTLDLGRELDATYSIPHTCSVVSPFESCQFGLCGEVTRQCGVDCAFASQKSWYRNPLI